MNANHPPGEAMDATLLLEYLDGELDPRARSAFVEHLAGCEACRTSVSALEAQTRRAGAALRAADFEPPTEEQWRKVLDTVEAGARSRTRAARFRTAAGWVVGVLAVGALASTPVRAWLVQRWAAVVRRDAVAAPATGIGDAAALTFHADGPALGVVFATTQARGDVRVRFTDDPTARVDVTGPGGGALFAGRRGLRVDNDSASGASYRLAIPAGVDEVSVRVGRASAVVLGRGVRGGAEVVIRLDDGSLVRTRDPGDEH